MRTEKRPNWRSKKLRTFFSIKIIMITAQETVYYDYYCVCLFVHFLSANIHRCVHRERFDLFERSAFRRFHHVFICLCLCLTSLLLMHTLTHNRLCYGRVFLPFLQSVFRSFFCRNVLTIFFFHSLLHQHR